MSKARVTYVGLIQNIVGKREDTLELPDGATVGDLLNLLANKYGEGFQYALVTARGELRPTTRILINGEIIDQAEGLKTRLKADAEMCFVVAVYAPSGG